MFERYEAEQLSFLQTLNANWLPYIHGEKIMPNQQSHSTASASEAEPPVIDSLPTDQNHCLSETNDMTSHRTLNTVTRNGQSNNQDHENGLETSSAKKRIEKNMREWANSMNDTRTPIQPRARFDVSPGRNKHRHYPWYPNSRESSANAEERDITPIAGRHYNTGHSSSSLPN